MPSLAYPQVLVRADKAGTFLAHHPWVLASSLIVPVDQPQLGEVVDLVVADGGRWLGRGLYNPHSRIRLRLYAWSEQQSLDAAWFEQQLDQALSLRSGPLAATNSDCQRLIYSEGDGLSGLIVDRYGDYLVMQLNAGCLLPWVDRFAEHLVQRLTPAGIWLQIDPKLAAAEGIDRSSQWLCGGPPDQQLLVSDGSLKLAVDLAEGQKTGLYLDQHLNRWQAARSAPAEGRCLDICCYSGGFGLAIAQQRPQLQVIGVDSSGVALEIARGNASRNGLENISFQQQDCFKALEQFGAAGERFDMVILDPPRFASARSQIAAALRAYHRLNLLAVNVLKPGGLLVSCSCSGRVERADFRRVLVGVSRRSRREIQLLSESGAPPDHPVSLSCPESDYLKCLMARVL